MQVWQQQHDGVVDKGGLFVLGTERHESRRIDNQLRGRCARQGDPGETQFFLSVEDELVRRFGGDRIKGTLEMFKWDEDVPVENSVLVKSVENAQQKVEGINFEIRKQLVDYDDVANTQRDVIYKLRDRIVDGGEFREEIADYIKTALTRAVEISSKATPQSGTPKASNAKSAATSPSSKSSHPKTTSSENPSPKSKRNSTTT